MNVFKLPVNDLEDNDSFGEIVAISGNGRRAIVGAPQALKGNGAVYIFNKINGEWKFEYKLESLKDIDLGGFGSTLSISEDSSIIVVGSHNLNKVYIFKFISSCWVLSDIIESDDDEKFGTLVHISKDGSDIFIKKEFITDSINCYNLVNSKWSMYLAFNVKNDKHPNFNITSIATSHEKEVLLIGGFTIDTSKSVPVRKGVVFLCHSNTIEHLSDDNYSAVSTPFFGENVTISADGKNIIISDIVTKDNAKGGSLHALKLTENGWVSNSYELKKELTSGAFGSSLAISPDGSILAVGACNTSFISNDMEVVESVIDSDSEKNPDLLSAGAVYIMKVVDNHWTTVKVLTAETPTTSSFFGYSLDFSNENDLLIGEIAGNNGDSTGYTGAAHIVKIT